MKHVPLVHIQNRHAYYADGRCPDFRLEPTDACARVLRNHRAIAKTRPDGIVILTPALAGGEPFLPFPRDTTLAFHLHLENHDFALFTDLTDWSRHAAPVYTNGSLAPVAGGELALSSRTASSAERVVIARPAPAERFALAGHPSAGTRAADFRIEGPAQLAPDGYDAAANAVTLDTRAGQAGTAVTLTYPATPRLPRGVFADVEIQGVDHRWAQGGPAVFHVSFPPKRMRWVYYFVTDIKQSPGVFQLADGARPAADAPLAFSDRNRTDLNEEPDPSDGLAAELAQRYPQQRRIRFVSDEPIPCRQSPRKHLELRIDGERLRGGLPNPPLRNLSRITIGTGTAAQQQESLFQVIKHQTQRLPSNGS